MKYKVKVFIAEKGIRYSPGDEIELTEERARQLGPAIEQKEMEAPENKMVGGKKWKFQRFDHLTKRL